MATATKKADAKALPRLKAQYRKEIAPALQKEFNLENPMQVPGLVKIVVNMGVGQAAKESKLIEGAVRDLTAITGQKPQVNLARKSIAQFKLREGQSDRGAKTGGIVTQEAPIHISNVSLVDPKSKKPTKAGFKIEITKDGKKKTRISRKSGEAI